LCLLRSEVVILHRDLGAERLNLRFDRALLPFGSDEGEIQGEKLVVGGVWLGR
jgi:hypothetical protein